MTHIISSNSLNNQIKINPEINRQIKELHRQLVALSFSQGNQSEAYLKTLNRIHALRNHR